MFGGSFSILHWIVVLAVVLLLFGGRGKVSAIMGDFGKGLRNFKTGLKGPDGDAGEDDAAEAIEASTRPAKKAATKQKRRPRRKPQQKRNQLAKKLVPKNRR